MFIGDLVSYTGITGKPNKMPYFITKQKKLKISFRKIIVSFNFSVCKYQEKNKNKKITFRKKVHRNPKEK